MSSKEATGDAVKNEPNTSKTRGRPKKGFEKTASSARPNRMSMIEANKPRSLRSSMSGPNSPVRPVIKGGIQKRSASRSEPTGKKRGRPSKVANEEAKLQSKEKPNEAIAMIHQKQVQDEEEDEDPEGPSYWLMKAEPNSRIEKGKDVKFSIEDLQNATAPEAWDGVRNAVARNNMRAMLKGDQAFFYHSNCKIPGVVGTMEIVQEHSVDESAFDKDHPYFDEKSTRESPKWCLVHVELRRRFPNMVSLKELQKYAKDGGVLESMQMLRQPRLSVSKVSKKEWEFILSLVDEDADTQIPMSHK